VLSLNSTRGHNAPTNVVVVENLHAHETGGGYLDNQQEFRVAETHIAKIAAKAKTRLELAGARKTLTSTEGL
jgi:hypothetical protein